MSNKLNKVSKQKQITIKKSNNKKVKITINMFMLLCLMIPLLMPLALNAQEPVEDMQTNIAEIKEEKIKQIREARATKGTIATNTAYGTDEEGNVENGVGEINVAEIDYSNLDYKINALTHEITLRTSLSADIAGDGYTFAMHVEDGINEVIIKEGNDKTDLTDGYIQDIDTTPTDLKYDYEIATGPLDNFYNSTRNMARDGRYKVYFTNTNNADATEINTIPIITTSNDAIEYMELEVPRAVLYNGAMYGVIGDGINESTDVSNVSVSEKIEPGLGTGTGVTKTYGIYELESIGYEDLNGTDVDTNPATANETDWTASDLTLAKYDHVIRPYEGNYLIESKIDASVTNESNLKSDAVGGWSTDINGDGVVDTNDGFRPLGQKIGATSGSDNVPFTTELTGDGDVIDPSLAGLDNGYIKNIHIAQSGMDNLGLIGSTDGANINNLGIADASIEGKENVGAVVGNSTNTEYTNVYGVTNKENISGNVVGEVNVGGLIGLSQGDTLVSEGRMLGEIPGWKDTKVNQPKTTDPDRDGYKMFNTLDVVSNTTTAGGLVGKSVGTSINKAYNKGIIKATSQVGGLVGEGNPQIENSYNHGDIIGTTILGGLVGEVTQVGATINASYNRGGLKNEDSTYIGGIVGKIDDTVSMPISNTYNQGVITVYEYGGGIVGYGNAPLTDVYSLGPIEVLKDSTGVYSAKPYVGGVVGSFGTNATPASLTRVFGSSEVTYAVLDQNDPRETMTYVGDVLGQPKDDTTYTTPTVVGTLYSLDDIALALSTDLAYELQRISLSEAVTSTFWKNTLQFPSTSWNMTTIAKPSPDSDPQDESLDDSTSLIDDLGYYAQIKEVREDGVVVEVPEQRATPYYRDIVDYKIDAMSLDIIIKYEDQTALEKEGVELKLAEVNKFRTPTVLACTADEDASNDTLTFSGEECGIQPDTEYEIFVDGLLNGSIYLYVHTPKQYIDTDGTTYALVGDGVNANTYDGIRAEGGTEGVTDYDNQNSSSTPDNVEKYGIYELESICYEEAADSAGDSPSFYPIMRTKNEWTENDLTISKYDHIIRPCNGNYMVVGDVDASATKEEDGALVLDKDGGFSQVMNNGTTAYYNNGFNPISLGNTYDSSSEKSLQFTGKIYGASDEVGTQNLIHINNLYIDTLHDYVGLISRTSSTAEVKNIAMTNTNVSGAARTSGVVGYNYGLIERCYVEGVIDGTSYTGGLVGYNNGSSAKINNSYFDGETTGTTIIGGIVGYSSSGSSINNSFAIGSVQGTSSSVGGVSGNANSATIDNSYFNGEVSGTSYTGGIVGSSTGDDISNSYAQGSVEGTTKVGGIVGQANGTDLSNSYSIGDIIGHDDVGGIGGYTHGSTTISNSYSAADVTAEAAEAGSLVGNDDVGPNLFTNTYSYEGQEVLINGEEMFQAVGGDNDTDEYEIATVTYEDFIAEAFYTDDLTWDMSTVWENTDYINHPHLIRGADNFSEYETSQIDEAKVDIADVETAQKILNYKIDANTGNIYLLLGENLVKNDARSTSLDVSVTPESGYLGGGTGSEKIRLGDEEDTAATNNYLFIDGTKYDVRPDSIYTVSVSNTTLGTNDSFKVHTPLKYADGYIPIGDETVSHTDVDNKFDTTTVYPEDDRDGYELYELESICYEHAYANDVRWTENDLTLTKYDHVIRPCDANYRLEDDIDMAAVKETTGKLDIDGGWTTDENENGILDATDAMDGFRPIEYMSGTLEGNDKTITNLYINAPSNATEYGLIGRLESKSNLSKAIVENLTFENSEVSGVKSTGTVVGYIDRGTVSNVHILNTAVVGSENFTGGIVGYGGVTSLVSDSSVSNGNIKGSSQVGGIVGKNVGTIDSCKVELTDVNGTSSYVGGLAGDLNGSARSSYFKDGNITGLSYTGGLAGTGVGTLSNNYVNNANIEGKSYTGGLIGNGGTGTYSYNYIINSNIYGTSYIGGLYGTMSYGKSFNCFSNATIEVSTVKGDAVGIGGLIGYDSAYSNSGTFNNNYYQGNINIEYEGGGLVGYVGGMVGKSYYNSTSTSNHTNYEENYVSGNINITTDGTGTDYLYGVGGMIGVREYKPKFYGQNNFTKMNITYPSSVVPLSDEEDIYVGSLIGYDYENTMIDTTNNMYVYDGLTVNGGILPPNRYVGNDPSTDSAVSSYPGLHEASISDFSDSAWYSNSAAAEGSGVLFDSAMWQAPYVEGTSVCLPHLYDENGATGGVFFPGQTCDVLTTVRVSNDEDKNKVDVGQIQKQSKNNGNINLTSNESQDEFLLPEEEEDSDLYSNLALYCEITGYDYDLLVNKLEISSSNELKQIISKLNNIDIEILLSKEEQINSLLDNILQK